MSRVDERLGDDSIGLQLTELGARIEALSMRVDQLAARTDELAYETKMERRATDEGLSALLERLRLLEVPHAEAETPGPGAFARDR